MNNKEMSIEEQIKVFAAAAKAAASAVPKESVLGKTAAEIAVMISSYASDAQVFYRKGDLVNAFAAAAYGLGWLDCGGYLGYMKTAISGCPALNPAFPTELMDKLEEKTHRYQRMLTGALEAVSAAPDKETAPAAAASEIFCTVTSGLTYGETCLPKDMVNALCIFSYWYGWLDCGVRAGLFVITGDRHLFTI
ncbi:MAG: DUF357 domain-containing protein [Methanocorpusculum sp.]|nr:DUF357 domain-containing protein [Methanocorpusculum sp.]